MAQSESSLHPHIQSDSESGEDSLVTVTALLRFDSDRLSVRPIVGAAW